MRWAKEGRARRDRIRVKQLTAILVAYGYAILAGAIWTPVTEGTLSSGNVTLGSLGFVLHGIALYISPRGEA